MKATLGHGASTCSYARLARRRPDRASSESNTPNNQPVTTKYLYYAKRRGAEIAVVNPLREPGLERYWIPSVARERALRHEARRPLVHVHTGGDLAFLVGVLKALVEMPDGIDEAFVATQHGGLPGAAAAVRCARRWERSSKHRAARAARTSMRAFARAARRQAATRMFVWSMGLTQHAHGVDTIHALVNLGLARGLPGAPHRGLVPIRGHSGVQGGAEVGCVPATCRPRPGTAGPSVWGFPVPRRPGTDRDREIDGGSARGEVDVFWIVGGNFLETLPDEDAQRSRALQRPRLRIHQDIVLSPVDAGRAADTATCCSCRPRRGTSRPAAAPRRRPSAGSSSRRRFPAADRRGAGRSGRSSATCCARARPADSRVGPFEQRRRPSGARSPAPCRSTPASRRLAPGRPGAVGRRAPVCRRPVRDADGRRTSPP